MSLVGMIRVLIVSMSISHTVQAIQTAQIMLRPRDDPLLINHLNNRLIITRIIVCTFAGIIAPETIFTIPTRPVKSIKSIKFKF